MKNEKMFYLLTSFLIIILSIMGCKSADNKADGNTGVKNESAYPLTIKDSDGREIVFDKEPMRIISVSPSITEIIASLGMLNKLIARTDYCNYPEDVISIQSIGEMTHPNLEKIIELEPDLVIISTFTSDDYLTTLTSLGINVVKLYEESDFEGVYILFETLGKIMNVSAKADAIVKDMKEAIAQVLDVVKDTEMKTVYYVASFGEWGDYTAGGDTFVGGLLKLAGAVNIAEDVKGWSFSLERLIEADPEYIFINDYMYEDFISTAPYNELSAVKDGKVIIINVDMLERQSYRNIEVVREIAEILYPESFVD